jgi:hypothetical protein
MSRSLALVFLLALFGAPVQASTWVRAARVRQVQCATDRWQAWSIHYLQVGVLRDTGRDLEPEAYSHREKAAFDVAWSRTRTHEFCNALRSAMNSGRSVDLLVDEAAGLILDLRL